jgi:hypothetical protein
LGIFLNVRGFHPSGIACPTVPLENFATSITDGDSVLEVIGAMTSPIATSTNFHVLLSIHFRGEGR